MTARKNSQNELLLQTHRFDVERVSQTAGEGSVHTREIIRHPGAVVILPMVDSDRVCLIQNFRVSVGRKLIELPAGTLEPGEEPATAAHRELAEETGYRAQSVTCIHAFYASPGILDEKMVLMLATGLTAGPPNREPTETIENLVVSWEQALEMVDNRTIEDAKSISGLLFYDRLRQKSG